MSALTPCECLAWQARRLPEDPWLFHVDGLDWRWISFGTGAEAVARAARRVAEGLDREGLPIPARVAFSDLKTVPSLIADLAIAGAGHLACPWPVTSPGAARDLAPAAGAGWEGEALPPWLPAGAPVLSLGPPPRPDWRAWQRPDPAGAPTALAGSRAGGAVVLGPGGPVEVPSLRLTEVARELAAEIGTRREREITVLAEPLLNPQARLQLGWALLSGAALLLEPDARAFLGTAAWARPTVLFGGAAELARLGERLGRESGRRRRRLPFGRLHTWVLPPGETVPEELRSTFESRGVRLLAGPALRALPHRSTQAPPRGITGLQGG